MENIEIALENFDKITEIAHGLATDGQRTARGTFDSAYAEIDAVYSMLHTTYEQINDLSD